MPQEVSRHEMQLDRSQSVVLLVDVQERLMPAMADGESLVSECARLLRAANALEVPVLATEQYSKGLGKTVGPLAELIDADEAVEKLTFSSCGAEALVERLVSLGRKQIVVIGIESHVCVMQTVLDLLARDLQVHVPFDAVTSRSKTVREMALERMRQAGAVITCVESVLFEWLVQAGTDEFRIVSKMLKRAVTD